MRRGALARGSFFSFGSVEVDLEWDSELTCARGTDYRLAAHPLFLSQQLSQILLNFLLVLFCLALGM